MNRPGPSGRPLIPGFPSQQSTQPRTINTNGRIPTTKLVAGAATWASAGGSGLSAQAREASASSALDSYARATEAQQSSTRPFIDSDFPTLANPSNQPQSSQFASSAWNKPISSEQPQRQSRQPRTTSEQTAARTQRSGDGEDYFAPSNVAGQISGNRLAQTMSSTSGNEPPRRTSIFQNDGYQSGVFANRMIPPGMESQVEGDARDPGRLTSPSGLSQSLSSSRSPNPQGMNGAIGQDRISGGAPGLSSIGQRVVRQNDYSRPSPQIAQGLSSISPHDTFSGTVDTASPSTLEQQDQSFQQILDGMSPQDRWGLAGLTAAYQGPDEFRHSLAIGQDLSELGLRIDDPEPFLKTWTGPFASPDAHPPRPLNDDFTIPPCFSVQNVVPLETRINSFSDESLFYIFYTQPRDIMQELVAEELMGRKWRFHMLMGMWMTRDENAQPPVEVEQGVSESGTYWWWDYKSWSKVRRQYILKYTDLDDHLQRSGGVGAGMANRSGFNVVQDLERMAAGMGRGF